MPPVPTTVPDLEPGDLAPFVTTPAGQRREILLAVEGIHCANCIWNIENRLRQEPDVREARLNFSTKRLRIVWEGEIGRANDLAQAVRDLGYRAVAFDPAGPETGQQEERFLLICLAVAGFATMNIMMFSVPLWSSTLADMGLATREMMHWFSALIAFPAVLFAGQPFYRSAFAALRRGRTNMDVPITVGVAFACLMSIHQTIQGAEHAYFDSAVMLLFFLLIGRYLDARARGRARAVAQDLLGMMAGTAMVEEDGGQSRVLLARELKPGMVQLVAAGEKIAADGVVLSGESALDASLLTGETLPQGVKAGDRVFAGTLNMDQPLRVAVDRPQEGSLLSQIVRLMEQAEQGQARYVRLSDRVARAYTPVVHLLALVTFALWFWGVGAPWPQAVMVALSVLIITCPCALGLAVPVVQVLATGVLMKRGILVKSGDAFERLARVDTVIFDKTGTLTLGAPQLQSPEEYPAEIRQLAASLARFSRHPLSRALAKTWAAETPLDLTVTDHPGAGLETVWQGRRVRLGRPDWCGVALPPEQETEAALMVALSVEGGTSTLFRFADTLRPEAAATIRALQAQGVAVELLSGDREGPAAAVARDLGITTFRARQTPMDKTARLRELADAGHAVLMVGDGLNDAPSLMAASVSMSPSSAIDMTQNAADLVWTGSSLAAVKTALDIARLSQKLVRQNIGLAIAYNVVAIPVAMLGYITPMLAALAMSGSSLMVVGNAFRLNRWKK